MKETDIKVSRFGLFFVIANIVILTALFIVPGYTFLKQNLSALLALAPVEMCVYLFGIIVSVSFGVYVYQKPGKCKKLNTVKVVLHSMFLVGIICVASAWYSLILSGAFSLLTNLNKLGRVGVYALLFVAYDSILLFPYISEYMAKKQTKQSSLALENNAPIE